MANFKFIPGTISGAQNPMGIASTDNAGDYTIPFTDNRFPGVCLFGLTAGETWTGGSLLANGTRVLTYGGAILNYAIRYIQNDGYVNPVADADKGLTTDPYINTICRLTGLPFRVLQVLDKTRIVISDPNGTWQNGACWYANSRLYPNKKLKMNYDAVAFTMYGIGGNPFFPMFNGANYFMEFGNGNDPIDIIGQDTSAVNIVVTK